MPNQPDLQANDITDRGKTVACILLILFTLLPIWIIVWFWPDRIPSVKEGLKPVYIYEKYHIRLACIPESICCIDSFMAERAIVATEKKFQQDSLQKKVDDSLIKDSVNPGVISTGNKIFKNYKSADLIDLSTLVLILVGASGFLGNMIHIASSFTNFVGAGQFKRTWLLWYCVKPFTASALALGLYFVFRGGFLNYGADASSINIYGILTISILVGLFTDRATLKLSEVFDVIFSVKKDVKSGDTRPDKLEKVSVKIFPIIATLTDEIENIINIAGQNLESKKLIATINDEVVPISDITDSKATIKYIIPPHQKEKDIFALVIRDPDNNIIYNTILKKNSAAPDTTTTTNS